MRAFERHLTGSVLAAMASLIVLAAACGRASGRTQGAPSQSPVSAGADATAAAGTPLSADGGVRGYAEPPDAPMGAAAAATVPAASTGDRAAAGGSDIGAAASAPGDPGQTASDTGAGAPAGAAGDAVVAPTISVPPNETVIPLAATPAPAPGGQPTIGGCPVFPADNPWNQDISAMPVDANSATYIANIGGGNLHADFGGGGAYGIPYIVVPQSQPMVPINFTAYGDESDPGPYPIPLTAPVEGASSSTGDRHVLAVQQGTCKLYELFSAYPGAGAWDAGSGAVFDLRSNALRPDTWTSADAAGLPITAGLVRYDEVAAGQINHAVRFTVNTVRKAWVHPATHYGTSTSATRIPYGAKLRLKASYDISGFHGEALVILTALKKYGMIVADQGSSWYITGDADPRWDDNDLNQLKGVPGNMFEVVQLGQVYTYP
jgi:hypothetical protein